jgi:putative transposase
MNDQKNQFKSNRHITYSCKYHIIFCPKYRRAVLVNNVDKRLKSIIEEVILETKSTLIEMEIMPDHVHLLLEVDPQFGVHKLIKKIKGRSSRILRKEFLFLRKRLPTLWTHSYFIATVGGAPLSVIKKYIEDQKNV